MGTAHLVRRRFYAVVAAILAAVAVGCPVRIAVPGEVDLDLVDAVLAGLSSNADKLGAVEVDVTTVVEQFTVPRPTTIQRTVGELSVTFQMAPRSEFLNRTVFLGNRVRSDLLGAQGETIEVLHGQDGVWTQYVPADALAWIRRRDDMGNPPPVDPRDFGLCFFQETYASSLRESKLLEASLRESSRGMLAHVAIERPNGVQIVFDFAAEYDFLPVRVARLNTEGNLNLLSELTYQPVAGRSAWLPATEVRKLFPRGTTVDRPEEWTGVTTVTVASPRLLTQEEFDDAFAFTLPAGTRVSDNLKQDIYLVPDARDWTNGLRDWLLPVALLAVLVATGVLVRRYFRLWWRSNAKG
jgi:hypothetical protein